LLFAAQNCSKFTIPHVALANYDPLESFAARLFGQEPRLDADALAQTVAAMLADIRHQADQRQLGVTFTTDRRSFYIREQWPFAVDQAHSDKGKAGALVRYLRLSGFLSKSPKVLEAKESLVRGEENSRARAAIRSARRKKATLREKADLESATRRHRKLRRIVEQGSAWIDQEVRATPDCRDIATGWPIRWRNGLPIPVRNSCECSDTVWATTNSKGSPIFSPPRALKSAGDRPNTKTDAAFDQTASGLRQGIETEFVTASPNVITNHVLALLEAAMEVDIVELPGSAQFDEVAPDDNDTANVVSLPQAKPTQPSALAVWLKQVRKL
jgi:hypothetical protein